MPIFPNNGIAIAYESFGEGPPVLLIHGFGSSARVNWIDTGWVETLTSAGYRAVAFDNRGHGGSRKLYDTNLYFAHDWRRMPRSAGLPRYRACAVIGYSMGARIAAFPALRHPGRVSSAVWGGMGMNLITGLEDSEEIIEALTAEHWRA